MKDNNNNKTAPQEASVEEVQKHIDIIAQANECGVLMTVLCEKLGLKAHETTQAQFTATFSELQKARLKSEEFMQSQFMMAREVKTRKPREAKTIHLKNEFDADVKADKQKFVEKYRDQDLPKKDS